MSKTTRKSITKKLRFEIFKRDKFKCQYCGRSAPEAILHLDHINPVSKGGTNSHLNLITSCFDCNMGKKDRLINDNSIIEKQKLQLEELAEKQEQLKMMIKWRESLCNIKNQELESLVKVWKKLAPGYTPNENGKNKIKKLLREYSYVQVSEAMEIAAQRYLKFEESGDVTNESWNNAFNKIKGICYYSSMPKDKQIIYAKRGFIIGILNKKFNINFYDDIEIKRVIDEQIKQGNNLEDIEYLAKGCYSKSDFLENLREI